jgi:dsDNA-specific endonuclease/ATPase MutS2
MNGSKDMNGSENILEFDKIKELWKSYALTEGAKEKIEDTHPSLNELELNTWQRQTTEARQMIEKCGNPPLPSFSRIREIIESARRESCLSAEQLEKIAGSFQSVRRLKEYLKHCKMYEFSLAYYEENLDSCDEVREEILNQVRNGRVDDKATNLLYSLRKKLESENTRMHEKAEQIIRSGKKYMTDAFSTMRNGRICIPVKTEYRNKISGTVLDRSGSGSTVFIEPAAAARIYDEIQLLMLDEENEEMRIRYTLTALVLDVADIIEQNMRTVEGLDFSFSKGRLSLEYDGIEPQINTSRRIHLKDARHPLIDKSRCIPLCFDIGDDISGIIITGPNTGGKTVTLKTVALCCMMGQCGLHIPCREGDICMNSNYLCDIGDGQNLTENLSTFSAHLKNILEILDSVTKESLVVLDELGSGTDPAEGMGIAIAVLKELKKSNALFLVTTHYPEIKTYAQTEKGILNARMDFDRENLMPLYKLIIGESGESCAFSIAKRLGMPEHMIENASKAAYGEEYRDHIPTTPDCGKNHRDYIPITQPCDGDAWKNRKVLQSRPKIQKKKEVNAVSQSKALGFHLGDSVMVYPDKKIGIVCQTANEKGILRIQLPDRKIWINHKRIKLHVAAAELYPADYDFSILFESVENRKLRHQMERKYVEGQSVVTEE